jgi:hypothetical protein
MNAEYQQLAHRRTVIQELKRHIEDNFLEGCSEKKVLTCDALPFNQRQVPNESFIEVLHDLQAEDATLAAEMSKYDFRKREPKPIARVAEPAGDAAAKTGKARAKPGDAG